MVVHLHDHTTACSYVLLVQYKSSYTISHNNKTGTCKVVYKFYSLQFDEFIKLMNTRIVIMAECKSCVMFSAS